MVESLTETPPQDDLQQPSLQDPMVDAVDQVFEELDQTPLQPLNTIDEQSRSQYIDDVFAEMDRNNAEIIKRNISLAQMSDPDREAEIARLAKETGMSVELIHADVEAVKRFQQLQQLDAQKLALDSPILARQLSDPVFANIAYDDIESLTALEYAAQPFRSLLSGLPSVSGNFYQIAATPFGLLSEASTYLDRASGGTGEGLDPAGDVAELLNWIAEGQFALRDAWQGDLSRFGPAGRAAYGGLRSVTEQGPAIAAFLATRNPQFLYGFAAVNAGGSAVDKALSEGMSFSTAVPYGLTDAMIEIATERMPALRLFSDLKAGSPFVKTLLNQYAAEIPQEQLATFLQDMNAWAILPSNENKTVGDFLKERPAAAYETLIATLTAVGVQTGTIYAANRMLQRYGQSGFDPVLAKQIQEAIKAFEAQRTANVLSRVGEAAEASKVAARSPEKLTEYLSALFQESIEDGAMPESVLIDAQDLVEYGRENNVDVRTITEAIATQIDEAVVSGGSVAIPLQEYVQNIAATGHKLLNDLVRVQEEGMTAREAQQWTVDQAERFQEEADRMIEQNADNAEIQASAQEVLDSIKGEITKSGRFTEDVANKYAALHRAFAVTMADRLGLKPSEVYARYGLRVRSDLTQARGMARFSQHDNKKPSSKGYIEFPTSFLDGPSLITILEGADSSTFIHESGHFFFEVLRDMATDSRAPTQVKKDMAALLKFVGMDSLDQWNQRSIDERRDGHEKIARAFEAYLFEGKSPNLEMASLFQTLSRWLRRVYESLKDLRMNLNDDVRKVFDRMLATEAQIQSAMDARSMAPMFETADQAGMTQGEWDNYQALSGQLALDAEQELTARDLRNMKWLRNQRDALLKKQQRDNKAKIADVRKEVTQEVRSQPVYAARRFLTHGEITTEVDGQLQTQTVKDQGVKGHRLSIPALDQLYEEDTKTHWRSLPTGRFGLIANEGVHPNVIAQMFGFSSGDHLVQALLKAENEKDLIESLTQQRVLERYGDLQDKDAMNQAVDLALHNEARTRAVHAEMKALAKKTGRQNVLQSAARNFANQKIGEKRVRDIRPSRYAADEARAAKAALNARKKGDLSTAADEKRKQIIQHHFFKAANRANDEVEKLVRYLKKFDSKGTRKNIEPEYLDQIDQMLEGVDLRKGVTNRELDRRASLAQWVEQQQQMGLEPDIDQTLLNNAQRKHYRNLTLDELRDVSGAVKNIEHLGRLKKKLLTARDNRSFEQAVKDIVGTIKANAKRTIEPKIETRLPKDQGKTVFGQFLASHRKFGSYVRQMDGDTDGGTLWELLVRPINEAANREAVMREKATVALFELLDTHYSSKELAKLYSEQYVPGINNSISRMGRIMVALNMGNADNRQRLMDGRQWTEENINEILDPLDQRDWNFVQGVLDHINSYWPQIAAKEKRVTGTEPQKVEALTIKTRFGDYPGGYFPIKYDDRTAPRAYAHLSNEIKEQMIKGAYTRATTRRGHTKERVSNVTLPLRLDFGVIYEHLDQVIHDVTHHETLIDVNRLLGHKQVEAAITSHYGIDAYQALQNTVQDVAAGEVNSVHVFERSLDWIRSGVSIAAMGWNLGTALLQPFGLTQGIVRVGGKYVAKGISRWYRDNDSVNGTVEWIFSVSPFMRLRSKTLQREINEIRNKVEVTARKAILGKAEDSYFWLIAKAQMIADVPIWLGAYEKAMDQGRTEETAVQLADQAVIDSQGGGQTKDLARIQRGGPFMKLWTNFYSFFNTTWNLTAELVNRTHFRSPEEVGRFAVDMLMLYTIPATFSYLLRDVLVKGECDFGTDAECLAKNVVQQNAGYMAGTLVGIREVTSALQGFYGYTGPAGIRGFAELSNLMGQVAQGEVDESLVQSLNKTAGIFLHYPAGQVERTAEGLIAMLKGNTINPLSLAIGPPKD